MPTLSTLRLYLSNNWEGVGPKSQESLGITETENGSMKPNYLAEVILHADHYLTR